jgi:hypothetical protein
MQGNQSGTNGYKVHSLCDVSFSPQQSVRTFSSGEEQKWYSEMSDGIPVVKLATVSQAFLSPEA